MALSGGVDLFASFQNSQLEVFYSWKADPQANAVDAFVQNWSNHRLYCFPPFALIGRWCLQKIRSDNIQLAFLIAPTWPAQTCYPLLLSMLINHSLILLSYSDLLKNPQGESHPLVLQNHLHLAAWPISGNLYEFLNSLHLIILCDRIWENPLQFAQCTFFITLGQNLSKSRFCHIHVK